MPLFLVDAVIANVSATYRVKNAAPRTPTQYSPPPSPASVRGLASLLADSYLGTCSAASSIEKAR